MYLDNLIDKRQAVIREVLPGPIDSERVQELMQ
jgi:hypothetical protein